MKEQVPEAFRSSYPFKGSPKIAYIDGMPLLMISEKSVRCWDDLLKHNFARNIVRYFRLGCRVVVLAFDDYDRVPMSKAITQANRSKKKAPYAFGEGEQLPPSIPHNFNEKLSNRIFKRRVIDMVCNRIASHVALSGSDVYTRRLVLDYTGCPIMFEAPGRALHFDVVARAPKFMVDVPPMGEADIKFLRWADYFDGDMVAASVDGDFLPIALMQCEERAFENKVYQQQLAARMITEKQRDHAGDLPKKPPPVRNICIFRIKYRSPGESRERKRKAELELAAAAVASKQRYITTIPARGGKTRLGLSSTNAEPLNDDASQKQQQQQQQQQQQAAPPVAYVPREFEYVDIPKLYAGLSGAMHAMCPSIRRNPVHKYHYMRLLAVLVGLGGTDFSRGLPFVGPATLWSMVQQDTRVFSALLQSYDLATGLVLPRTASDSLACEIYMHKFARHFGAAPPADVFRSSSSSRAAISSDDDDDDESDSTAAHHYENSIPRRFDRICSVLRGRGCSLADKTKTDLPSALRVSVTFRNINWLLRYWSCVAPVPRRRRRPPADRSGDDDDDAQDDAIAGEEDQQQQPPWDYTGCYPDPISEDYGFKMGCKKKKKKKNKAISSKGNHAKAKASTCSFSSSSSSSSGGAVVRWMDEEDEEQDEEHDEEERAEDDGDEGC